MGISFAAASNMISVYECHRFFTIELQFSSLCNLSQGVSVLLVLLIRLGVPSAMCTNTATSPLTFFLERNFHGLFSIRHLHGLCLEHPNCQMIEETDANNLTQLTQVSDLSLNPQCLKHFLQFLGK